jgi:hypothetical protein
MIQTGKQQAVLRYLERAGAQVEAAQAAVINGEILMAASCLEEARALQREAVAELVVGCWQEVMERVDDEDGQRREEALAHLKRLTGTVLKTLCTDCRQKIAARLATGKK